MTAMPTPKFVNVKNSSFHQELKKRVQSYFENERTTMFGGSKILIKAIILWSLYIAGYVHLIFYTPSTWIAVFECIVMGLVTATIGFNVMHDGGHGSFSRNKTINQIAAYSVNILGASALMWHSKHNIIHHTYTNIDGVDDDISSGGLIRMAPTQKWSPMHRFQHIYSWFLYGLLLLMWITFTDYKKYFTQKVGSVAIKKLSTKQNIGFWVAKVFYLGIMVVLPIIKVGFLPWLVGYFVIAFTAGVVLSVVFQLAHLVEETTFPMPDDMNKIENEWAIHQTNTTANFATNNKLISWLVGGLNFQVEHHLFPKISHIHYPAINKIVKDTCKEYGVKYIEFATIGSAISSHSQHLKNLGSKA